MATLIVGTCLLARKWPGEPVEQRIAAVNARHVPASGQNAATIYDQLAVSQVIVGNPADPRLTPAAVSALIEASGIESCWFPLSLGEGCYRDHARRMRPMGEWARALASAARDDVAIGEVDAAAQKLHCILQMADHLRQQALIIGLGAGNGIEAHAWSCLRDLVMQSEAGEDLLKMAETMPGGLENDSRQAFGLILQVQPLITRSVLAEWSLRQRVKYWWRQRRGKTDEEILREWYLRSLAMRRGVRVLVGLRRYRDANGRWPESLGDLAPFVANGVTIDPYTEKPFVYRVAGDEFCLYAKGRNGIDDGGMPTGQADDRPIWPPSMPTTRQ
jgi:hypothetical protein